MDKHPPNWVMKFLEKTCSSKFLDELQGDLLELFYRDLERLGVRKANNRMIWRALLSPRIYRLPNFFSFQAIIMYRINFKVAFRHAAKHRSATIVQSLGLMLGLAAVLYIGLFIKNELLFDKMHEKGDKLYRVLRVNMETGQRTHSTSSRHGASLQDEYSFIKVCRFGNDPVKIGEERPILVDDFYWSDSTFFDLFSFPFIDGDPATCLDRVNSLVLTRSLSMQLFGRENSVGESIKLKVYDGNQEFLMQVTGVVEDPPKQTHIQFKALGSMQNAEELYASLVGSWGFSWLRTYVYVPEKRIAEVEAGIPFYIKKHFGEDPPPGVGVSFQAFHDVYLHSQDIPRNTFRGDIKNLRIFGAIGLLILLISLLNYVNLATARAVTRSKEIGIRKVLGTRKWSIIWQFIMESVLFTFGGGILAITILLVSLPYLNMLFDLDLSFQIVQWYEWIYVLLGLVLLGMIAGILPSLAMSRLPVFSKQRSSIQFKPLQWSLTRKFFVGLQYLITLVLMVATLVIYKQYLYLKNFDLGFESSQLLHIPVEDRSVQERLDLLKEQISEAPGVLGATGTGEDLPSALNNTWELSWQGADPENDYVIDIVGIDQDYFDLLGIPFKAGGNFTRPLLVDSARSVILNAKAQEYIGLEDIVGQQLEIGGKQRTVVGVVEDHHNTTLHSQLVPLAYFLYPPGYRVSPDNLLVKLDTENLNSLLGQLEEIWGEFSTDPFEYNFVDEAFAQAYTAERRFSSLVSSFTIIAILISVVGLFGLINFIVQLKLKEIGIRRVLGASPYHLLRLLGKDFLIVFTFALIFALPFAYYFLDAWLNNYAFHIQINGGLFLLAVLLCLGISGLIIFFHLHRTNRINPAEVLAAE